MSSRFTRRRNNGGVEGLVDRVREPGTVDVGIIDAGSHDSGDLTVAQIGFANEFGTVIIPERSFMRSTIVEKKNEIIALQRELLSKISSGDMQLVTALGLVGEKVSDDVKQKITSIRTPPNSPMTIERKGSSNPLIDTGQLRNSITFEVNR
jgi:hypothetical protein